jgi:hypothetical protein
VLAAVCQGRCKLRHMPQCDLMIRPGTMEDSEGKGYAASARGRLPEIAAVSPRAM